MKLVQSFLTKNPCYTAGRTITVKGLMLHSVGCAQSDAQTFINSWNKASYSSACVHAFIDGNDGTVYQTLPWTRRGWHCGGDGNNTHIGVEMCEPSSIKYTSGANFTCSNKTDAKATVKRTYESAVALFAMLCEKYDLNPLTDICSHKEGASQGIATSHSDPEHLWTGLGTGYTMDGFRKAVKAAMGSASTQTSSSMTSKSTAAAVLKVAIAEIGYTEKETNSQLDSKTANSGDGNYTKYARDFDEKYPNWYCGKKNGYAWCDMFVDWCFLTAFGYDEALRLLCQPEKSAGAGCTYSLGYYKKKGQFHTSGPKAGDQIFFGSSTSNVSHTGIVEKADNAKVYTIEGNSSNKVARRSYSLKDSSIVGYGRPDYGGTSATSGSSEETAVSYRVRITIENLYIRAGAGTNYASKGFIKPGVYTVVAESDGDGATKWGKLKSGAGWVSLDYCEKL